MSVTRLKGKTCFSTYVISVFVDSDRVQRIDICGKPHPSVTEICKCLEKARTSCCDDTIKAIKLTMAKHNEYRGFAND